MKTKRILSLLLAMVMVLAVLFTACTEVPQENETSSFEQSESSENETSSQEAEDKTEETSKNESDSNVTVEGSSDTEKETETEEESEVITDVMIGETLEAEYAADFTVAKIFSGDMVVQRNEHIRVWGFAPESENGKKVSGEFKGMFAEAIIENGEWCITFGARLEADVNGADMKIYTDEKEIVFSGVLVGDVYLVMGQSNAAYSVNDHLTYTDPATQGGGRDAISQNSIIRLNHLNGSGGAYGKKGSDYVYPDLLNDKQWTKTTLTDTLTFSAIGYYFARQMVEKSGNTVPVGLMEVAVGGAPLASFLPNELADLYGGDYYDPTSDKYFSTISAEHMGRYLYNCYLAPVSRYAIAGVVWYQGESNNSQQNAINYCKEFGGFADYLRSTHNLVNKDFPIFAVEFPTIYKKPSGFSGTWHYMEVGIIRSYMGLLPISVKNCYVSASGDLWSNDTFFNNLHPNCKYEQAERLADIAEVVVLGKGDLNEVSGPVFKSATVSDDKKTVVITFSNVGEGLTTADGGAAVKGLVGFEDRDFIYSTVTPVSATITAKDQITVVFSQEVKAVAYNYSTTDHYGDTLNLCGSTQIPALAFITPYEEKDVGGFTADSFVSEGHTSVKKVAKFVDSLQADGSDLFPIGEVELRLSSSGNIVDVPEGTSFVNVAGWIGFKYETMLFGYSVDGGNAIFDSYPIYPNDAVLDAGGNNARRFKVNMRVGDLGLGEHTLTLLALIDLKDGTAVNILSFKINIVEKEPAPEGTDLPHFGDGDYGYKNSSYDHLKVDSTTLYDLGFDVKLQTVKNRITVSSSAASLFFSGWIGFETEIESFGYAIDGGEPILNSAPINPEAAVTAAGGEFAKRYKITADISQIEVGEHAFDMLIKIKTKDGSTVLKMLSFILVISE